MNNSFDIIINESIFDEGLIHRRLNAPFSVRVVSLPTSLNAKGPARDNCSCRGTKLRIRGFRAVSRLRLESWESEPHPCTSKGEKNCEKEEEKNYPRNVDGDKISLTSSFEITRKKCCEFRKRRFSNSISRQRETRKGGMMIPGIGRVARFTMQEASHLTQPPDIVEPEKREGKRKIRRRR